MNKIITISRENGSSGRRIGRALAEKLGVPFYDRSLIEIAAKESGYAEKLFEDADRRTTTSSFLYTVLHAGNLSAVGYDMPLNDKLYIIQSNVIKKVAEEGPCVIVGRCADYILRENENLVSVYLHAPEKERLKQIISEDGVEEKNAREVLSKMDKRRAAYYNFYTGRKWGKAENFDICLDSSRLGPEGTAELLYDFVIKMN